MSDLKMAARALLDACECASPEDDMFPAAMQRLRAALGIVAEGARQASALHPGERAESKGGHGADPALSGSRGTHPSNCPKEQTQTRETS